MSRRSLLARFGSGLLFGLTLQLSVGPVCLYVLKTALDRGLFPALAATLAVTLADGLYIAAAYAGLARFIDRPALKRPFAWAGSAILIAMGIWMAAGAMKAPVGSQEIQVPQMLQSKAGFWSDLGGAWLGAFLLTAANPLTIVFWAGVFSSQVAARGENRSALYALGALVPTPLFLGVVSGATVMGAQFLSPALVRVFGIGAGCAVVLFGLRSLRFRRSD